jgi:hypothetical protein
LYAFAPKLTLKTNKSISIMTMTQMCSLYTIDHPSQKTSSFKKLAYPSPNTSCPTSPVFQKCKVKKRKSVPLRSIPQTFCAAQKLMEGIVQLDVYNAYLANPSTLLTSNPTPKPSPTSHFKIDLSRYKNTHGAPTVVWKKGIPH